MLDKLKNLTKSSLIYGSGHVLGRLVTFLLLPYYSFRITPAEYGEVALYYLFLAVVQTFFFYGLDIAYLRYYSLTSDPLERKRITGTTLWAALLSSSALTLVIFLASGTLGAWLIDQPVRPQEVSGFIRICSGILFFDTLSAFPFILLRTTNRPYRFITFKIFGVVLNVGLNVLLIGQFGMTTDGILWANLISSALTFLAVLPLIIRECAPGFDYKTLREMIAFGLPNIPTYLFVMVVELASRKIVELTRGIEEAGLFSAGYKLGMFMAVVTGAFRFAWQPFFLSHSQEESAPVLFARVMTYYVLIAVILFLGLSLFAPLLLTSDLPVVGRLLDERYLPGLVVFPLILFAHIFDGVYANLMVGVYLKKLTRYLPIPTGAAALFTIFANLWLTPRFGMMAAAWITLGAFIMQAVILFLIVDRHYHVPYEWRRMTTLFLTAIGIFSLSLLPMLQPLAFKCLLFFGFFAILFVLRFPDSRELSHLKRIFARA